MNAAAKTDYANADIKAAKKALAELTKVRVTASDVLDQLRDEVTAAMQGGSTIREIAASLAEVGIQISSRTITQWLSDNGLNKTRAKTAKKATVVQPDAQAEGGEHVA